MNKRLAAIDIGSNAARLLITEVIEGPGGEVQFTKLNLIRVPLRLGFDVFETGKITTARQQMLIKTMMAYRNLLDVYNVSHLKACATSAMRDAANANELIATVANLTGIVIEVISGQQEASFIFENHIAEQLQKDQAYLYIDVGGGSTELTIFQDGKLKDKASFNIGTIRLLKNQVEPESWDEMKQFIKVNIPKNQIIKGIGSGGNINKIFSLSKRKEGKPLTADQLRDYHKEFSAVSLEDRMKLYKLREDRADVIVPALQIYNNVMRWADVTEIYVPKIGLADGLVHILYDELKTSGLL